MLICPACKDSWWEALRFEEGTMLGCKGHRKVAEDDMGVTFSRCSEVILLAPSTSYQATNVLDFREYSFK